MTYPVLFSGGLEAEVEPIVYGLTDPREPGRVRYVGRTTRPAHRYATHCGDRRTTSGRRRIAWCREMRESGVSPVMVLLERCDQSDLAERETVWIQRLRVMGEADLNGVDRETARRTGMAVRAAHRRRVARVMAQPA